MYYYDGSRYEGDFKNNIIEGKGIIYYNNGEREMGNFSNNMKIGKHVMSKKMETFRFIIIILYNIYINYLF